jgi:hypothetical protein
MGALLVYRRPTDTELRLLTELTADSDPRPAEWLVGMLVAPLSDGGMGSLRLAPMGVDGPGRMIGRITAERTYRDADGTQVLVSLVVDRDGAPYELDVWKVDFTPVVDLFSYEESNRGHSSSPSS